MQSKLNGLKREHQKFFSVIASSSSDRMAMAAAFYPVSYNDVWVTGLPRHDFIVRKKSKLPIDLQDEMKRLRKKLKGRKLILFAPTFRNDSDDGYYFYTLKEKRQLYKLLKDNNAVLGIREHMADAKHAYSNELKDDNIIDLSSKNYSNIEILYRLADILITDYSSCFIDFMLTGKPMLSFAYDLEKYAEKERGFFYDIDLVFPGKICKDFNALYENLEKLLIYPVTNKDPLYDFKRRTFFDNMDDQNSKRVVDRVRDIL
jgi:CDP-glycerol glycerophosphotransferase (TagB/SpsB family)